MIISSQTDQSAMEVFQRRGLNGLVSVAATEICTGTERKSVPKSEHLLDINTETVAELSTSESNCRLVELRSYSVDETILITVNDRLVSDVVGARVAVVIDKMATVRSEYADHAFCSYCVSVDTVRKVRTLQMIFEINCTSHVTL